MKLRITIRVRSGPAVELELKIVKRLFIGTQCTSVLTAYKITR